MKEALSIYTDISIDHKINVGFGSFLVIPSKYDKQESDIDFSCFVDSIQFHCVDTALAELTTIIYALQRVKDNLFKRGYYSVKLYTDSQYCTSLVKKDYYISIKNKNKNKHLLRQMHVTFSNLLYHLNPEVIKVKGHTLPQDRTIVDKNFSFVDQKARSVLRNYRDACKHRVVPLF